MNKLLPSILVVDGDHKNINILKSILEDTKIYKVVCVDTDEQALQEINENQFSLLLIDALLLSKEIVNKKIPTILLFENLKVNKEKAKFIYEILDYIEKPFDSEELLHRVKIHMKSRSVVCSEQTKRVLSLSIKSLKNISQDYTQLIEDDEVNAYNIYNEYKNIEYLMSKPENIENYLCQSLRKSLNSYCKEDSTKKKNMLIGINNQVSKFIDELLKLKPIVVQKDEWYKNASKYLKLLSQNQGSFLQIDDKDVTDYINILNYDLIVEFFTKYRSSIKPQSTFKLLTKEQEILLKIAPSLVLFFDIDELMLLEIVKTINFSKYHSGEMIYDHRERVHTLDYILSGKVDFFTYKKKHIVTLNSKQLFGESIFDKNKIFRYVDIVAKGDVVLLSMTIDMKKRELYPEVFFKLYENVISSVSEKINLLADLGIKP